MSYTHSHITLVGNLTRDPECRATSSSQVANFSIAVNRRYKQGEEMREEVAFIDCEAWGFIAQRLQERGHKGKTVFCEGYFKQDNWEDKQTGQKRSRLRVRVNNLHFVEQGAAGEHNPQQASSTHTPVRAQSTATNYHAPPSHDPFANSAIEEDDPPF